MILDSTTFFPDAPDSPTKPFCKKENGVTQNITFKSKCFSEKGKNDHKMVPDLI